MTIFPPRLSFVLHSKSATVEFPSNSEDVSMLFTEDALTITDVTVVLRGTTPSVTWTLKHALDRSEGSPNDVVGGSTTSTNTTTGDSPTLAGDVTVPLNSYLWVETSATSGTIEEFSLTFTYTID